ncbi:hypothetical protein Tco_1333257 [Tanacetum coccineum]
MWITASDSSIYSNVEALIQIRLKLKLHLVGLKCSTFHQSHQSKVGVAAVALQSYVGAVISVEQVVVRILLKGGIYFAFLLELLLPVRICIALSSARMKIVLLSSSPLNFAVGNHHSFAIHFGPTFLAIIPELVARALLNAATTTLFLFLYETIRVIAVAVALQSEVAAVLS